MLGKTKDQNGGNSAGLRTFKFLNQTILSSSYDPENTNYISANCCFMR